MEPESLDQTLSDQDRVLLVFGYLGPLALVTLVASRRGFVKWHAKQGLALTMTVVALYPLIYFVKFVLDSYFWRPLGELFRVAIWLGAVGLVVAMLVGIIRGLEGERFRIPLLADLADRL